MLHLMAVTVTICTLLACSAAVVQGSFFTGHAIRTCTAPGDRCAGAKGRPFVKYAECCERGNICVPDEAKGWGLFCVDHVSKAYEHQCYRDGIRCAGAPGKPFVIWKRCCDSKAVCVEDISKGYGRVCLRPQRPAESAYLSGPGQTMPSTEGIPAANEAKMTHKVSPGYQDTPHQRPRLAEEVVSYTSGNRAHHYPAAPKIYPDASSTAYKIAKGEVAAEGQRTEFCKPQSLDIGTFKLSDSTPPSNEVPFYFEFTIEKNPCGDASLDRESLSQADMMELELTICRAGSESLGDVIISCGIYQVATGSWIGRFVFLLTRTLTAMEQQRLSTACKSAGDIRVGGSITRSRWRHGLPFGLPVPVPIAPTAPATVAPATISTAPPTATPAVPTVAPTTSHTVAPTFASTSTPTDLPTTLGPEDTAPQTTDASTAPTKTSTEALTTSTEAMTASTEAMTTSTEPLTASTEALTTSTGPLTTATGPPTSTTPPLATETSSTAPISTPAVTTTAAETSSIAPTSTPALTATAAETSSTAPTSTAALTTTASETSSTAPTSTPSLTTTAAETTASTTCTNLEFTLTWTTAEDLDLFVQTPSGVSIFDPTLPTSVGSKNQDDGVEGKVFQLGTATETVTITCPFESGEYKVIVADNGRFFNGDGICYGTNSYTLLASSGAVIYEGPTTRTTTGSSGTDTTFWVTV